jgi:hypothetical protein
MGFEDKNYNGKDYKQSDNVYQWKIVHLGSKIILLIKDSLTTSTIHECYSSLNFRDIKNYIEENNLDLDSIELENNSDFLDKVLETSTLPNDQDLIDFCDNLNFR